MFFASRLHGRQKGLAERYVSVGSLVLILIQGRIQCLWPVVNDRLSLISIIEPHHTTEISTNSPTRKDFRKKSADSWQSFKRNLFSRSHLAISPHTAHLKIAPKKLRKISRCSTHYIVCGFYSITLFKSLALQTVCHNYMETDGKFILRDGTHSSQFEQVVSHALSHYWVNDKAVCYTYHDPWVTLLQKKFTLTKLHKTSCRKKKNSVTRLVWNLETLN